MTDLQMIENALYGYIPRGNHKEQTLIDSMEYSMRAGGKRIRPQLVLEFSRICGGNDDAALPFGCALEMIHTYSLIHDDLPCMDDDDMRRGKPSNHKVFGEDTALLAGDALQSLAFEVASAPETIALCGADKACACINTLASCCGTLGMVGGQVIDLANEKKTATYDEIYACDEKKTGGLIIAACKMGAIVGGADEKKIRMAEKYGKCIGIAFQVVDDILDVTSTDEELGKPVGSDMENNKSTYVSLLGVEKCREMVQNLTAEAIDALSAFDGDTAPLRELALKLAKRKK